MAALRELLLRGAQPREVDARAGAAAEDDALAPDPVEDRVHRVLDREDEARRALGLLLEADVEPDRRVERRELVDEDRLELVLEGLRLVLGREVAALAAPAADRRRRPGRSSGARSVSRSGELMRPRKYFCATMFVAVCDQNFGNSTPFWSNAGLVLARDEGVARLPLDLVERVAARDREVPANGEAGVLSATVLTSSSGLNLNLAFLCSTTRFPAPPTPFLSFPSVGRHERRRQPNGDDAGLTSGPSSVSRASDGRRTAAGQKNLQRAAFCGLMKRRFYPRPRPRPGAVGGATAASPSRGCDRCQIIPTAPATTSRIASAPRISSGSGNECGSPGVRSARTPATPCFFLAAFASAASACRRVVAAVSVVVSVVVAPSVVVRGRRWSTAVVRRRALLRRVLVVRRGELRGQDVVLRARVDLDVRRQVLDRLARSRGSGRCCRSSRRTSRSAARFQHGARRLDAAGGRRDAQPRGHEAPQSSERG